MTGWIPDYVRLRIGGGRTVLIQASRPAGNREEASPPVRTSAAPLPSPAFAPVWSPSPALALKRKPFIALIEAVAAGAESLAALVVESV
ncbi:MAG TPA: hypothetical protein VNZ22_11255, partial [Bacillota bacterium]|nr:hypothetical protein [Bacillota bacterium]